MKNILIYLLICMTFSLFAQNENNSNVERKGFVLDKGIGGGAMSVDDSDAAAFTIGIDENCPARGNLLDNTNTPLTRF